MARLLGSARTHRWFLVCAFVSGVTFAVLITAGTGHLVGRELLADFYDYQAQSLVHGRLDVPLEAVRGEAFIYQGKFYGYFGLTPALFRVPFVIAGIGFGELSRCFMLVYFVASLWAAYLIYLRARRLVFVQRSEPGVWPVVLLTLNVGLGSSLLFLASRAYVYHEAILCGATFALWSLSFTLRYFEAQRPWWWAGALGCAVLAVHARPTTGLLALATLGFAAMWVAVRARGAGGNGQPRRAWIRPAGVAALVVVGTLSFNAVSYLKFGTLSGCSLRLHVQYTPERLARIDGGKLFRTANIPYSARLYSFGESIVVGPTFPYVDFKDPPRYLPPDLVFDIIEPIAGMPYVMPGLFVLALLGSAATCVQSPRLRGALVLIWAGGVPMALAMFAAIAISHRYTADFCPWLACAAALGISSFESVGRKARIFLWSAFMGLTVVGVAISLGLTLRYQGELVWGAADEARNRYLALCEKADALFHVRGNRDFDPNHLPIRFSDAENQLYVADNLFVGRRPMEAAACCVALLNEHPDEAALWFAVAKRFARAQVNLTAAKACFDGGMRLDPTNKTEPLEFAETLLTSGRTADAITVLRDVIARLPRSARAHYDLGAACANGAQLNDALQEFETAQRLDPGMKSAAQGVAQVKVMLSAIDGTKPPTGTATVAH